MTDDMEYALSCSICMELFTEPVLLPCAHSLCKACLDKLRKPPGKPAAKIIDCPHCRQKLDIGVNCENVKKNFQLASIIDIYRQESSRRQQLDAERPQQDQPTQQAQGAQQAQRTQQAQRIYQLQQSPQGAKPKLGLIAQLRQKQNQRKCRKNQQHINLANSSTDEANARAPSFQNVLAALRKTDSRPVPRRSAPPPPLPKPRDSLTLGAEQRDQGPPPLPRGRRSIGSLPERVPPPIPRRPSINLTLNQEQNNSATPQQPASPSDSSLEHRASPSGSHDSQGTQESEEAPEPTTELQSPSGTDHSSNTPIPNTEEQPFNSADTVPDQPNQNGQPISVSSNSPDPDILMNMPNVLFPEVPNQTEQVESANDLGPECCTCERVPAFPATVQCVTCAMLFCSSCLGAFHPEPDESQHEVKPIKEIKVEEKCVLCERENWSIFCMECYMLLCQGCQLGHHPAELKHWIHEAPVHRSLSVADIPVHHSQPALHRRTVSVPSGMATQGLEEATGCSSDETRCSSCSNAAFARCLDCGENLCEMCARVKHQSADLENHTVVKLSESKLKIEDVEKLVQLGLLELMLLKQALMDELSSKVNKD